jgi:hypothetical protein
VKFWRHLVVVAVAVAAVVTLGVVWEHSGAARWITPPAAPGAGGPGPRLGPGPGPGPRKVLSLPAGSRLPAGTRVPAGVKFVHINTGGERGMWFDLSDVGNLTNTAEIVAAVMAWVIVLDIARRRWRKARRAAARSVDPAGSVNPASSANPASSVDSAGSGET